MGASLGARVPVAWLSLVGANCVHDDLDALFSKHDRKREPGDAEPTATFFIRFACSGVSLDLSKDRFDLGNKLLAIPWARSFKVLRLVKQFSASSRVYAQWFHWVSRVASAITSSASCSLVSPLS